MYRIFCVFILSIMILCNLTSCKEKPHAMIIGKITKISKSTSFNGFIILLDNNYKYKFKAIESGNRFVIDAINNGELAEGREVTLLCKNMGSEQDPDYIIETYFINDKLKVKFGNKAEGR